MIKDERTTAGKDEQDPRTDPLNPLIAAALASDVMPPLDEEIDIEHAADSLTAADRAALDSLGSSEELVGEVLAGLAAQDQVTGQADVPTNVDSMDATVPDPGSPFWKDRRMGDHHELMARMESFECDEEVGWTFRYRKKRELGRGFQGVVYLTEYLDAFRGNQALKIYSPGPYGDVESYREDMERMGRVASFVHGIQQANVVDVQRFLDHNGIYVMIMQWIDGFDLRRLMQPNLAQRMRDQIELSRWEFLNDVIFTTPRPGRLCLQPGVAVYIIEKCLRGLSALHDKGIVHGDIKLSNIMPDCYGSVKLIDIGSAFEVQAPPREYTWTPRYAAPEFLARGECTPQSDLASLGYVLIELLSGQPAVTTPGTGERSTRTMTSDWDPALLEAKLQLLDRFPDLLPKGARICDRLIKLCRRLIHPDLRKRFASATDAIIGPDGTFNFDKELTVGDLVVHYPHAMAYWLADVKKVLP